MLTEQSFENMAQLFSYQDDVYQEGKMLTFYMFVMLECRRFAGGVYGRG